MSWWDDGDDVLGDKPADKLTAAWRTIFMGREERGVGLPSTEEALESFAAALRSAKVAPPLSRILMWRGKERLRAFDGSGSVLEIQEAFAAAMASIARDYERQVDRLPKPSELIKTLEFILGPAPQEFFADATEEQWDELSLSAE